MKIQNKLLVLLQKLLNQAMTLDPFYEETLANSPDFAVAIELSSPNLAVIIQKLGNALTLYSKDDFRLPLDCHLFAPPVTLLSLSLTRNMSLLSNEQVCLTGDSSALRDMLELMDALQVDWEELLSNVTGDVLAYTLCQQSQNAREYSKARLHALKENLSDYLTQESQLSIHPVELKRYADEVDALKLRVDRLTARIEKLSIKL